MIQFDSPQTRRLPVYLLLDISGSMAGSPVEALNQGLQLLLDELKKDPMALETAWISVITFHDDAVEALPLTEVSQANIQPQNAGGSTNLGAALHLLLEKLKSEIRPNTSKQKGDYKPMIFLLSDGQPTDKQWQSNAVELREYTNRRAANVIAVGCGPQINFEVLKQITPNTLSMPDVTGDNIMSFFKWVTQSVKVTSQKEPTSADAEAAVNLPPLPNVIQIVK